jgi:hypothetical protein
MIGDTTGVMTVAKLGFHVTEIPEEGLDLADEVQPDELGLLPEEAQVRGSLSLSARLTNVGDHVYVEGVLKSRSRQPIKGRIPWSEAGDEPQRIVIRSLMRKRLLRRPMRKTIYMPAQVIG